MAARDKEGSTAWGGMGRECDREKNVGILADPKLEEVLDLSQEPGFVEELLGDVFPAVGRMELRGKPVGAVG